MLELHLILVATIAGMLTVLAPCILPLLPLILTGSATTSKNYKKPLLVIGALAVSIFVFTLGIRSITSLTGLSAQELQKISGWIIVVFGLATLFPMYWEKLAAKLGLGSNSNKLLSKYANKGGVAGDMMAGVALGPVFTSCSPTFAVILGLVLGGDSVVGSTYLLFYIIGLSGVLIAIAVLGQKFIAKLGWATDPAGKFKRGLGLIFIIVGLGIATGYDKKLETWLLERGVYQPIAEFEDRLLND